MTALHRNAWIDAVRGVAIVQVFGWHFVAPLLIAKFGVVGSLFSLTWSGVDLFFVLSGYLIGGILLRNVDATNYYSVFYARRLLRILPLYAVALAIFFAFHPELIGWEYFVLVQNFVWSAQNTLGPGDIAATWSLAVEEQFYLLLPLLLRLCPPKRVPYLCVALIVLAPLFRLGCHLGGYPYAAYLLLPARMDALLLGVLLAWAVASGHLDRALRIARLLIVPFGLAMVGFALLKLNPIDPLISIVGCSVIAGFYCCVLTLVVSADRRLPVWLRGLAWAGLGAYSIYLFHSMIGSLSYRIFGPHPIAMAAMIAAIALVALLCWVLIEKPLIAFGHRRFRYRSPATD